MTRDPRVAFIFTNSREGIIARAKKGEDADTSLWGFNHFPNAQQYTADPRSVWSLRLIPQLLRYDFIVAQDNFLLGYLVSVCARIFRKRTRWFFVTMTSSTLIRRHRMHPIRLSLLKMFWSSYARIICLSYEQIEDLAALGIPREKLTFVPFGVDTDFFQPTETSLEEDLVVSVGRDAGRDYPTLFKAAAQSNHPFIVVSGHKNIPSDSPIPANISVLYDRSLAEIRDLYARARLVIIVSKDAGVPDGSDCSGQIVILDALAAGKTVIATRRPWMADYFVPDHDLVIVPPNDPESLVQAIDSLSHDALKRQFLATSGHQKVALHYTTNTFAEALRSCMDSFV